ncbi:MAG TPA: PAS domain S-box protein [Desulfomonilaceae bacterium]|nr:PAS domain S-box protein [Desulfomonilaceae bacterium]
MSDGNLPSVSDVCDEQTEQRLLEIERSKKEFFAEARDGFYISIRQGQFIDCNEALVRMLGYSSRQEVLNLDLNTELWGNLEDRPKFQARIEEHGFVRDYEGTFRRKDGKLINVSLSTYVWRDKDGNIGGYRGFVVDRTQEKLMRDQLAASETKYKDLFNNIPDGVFSADAKGTVTDCNEALFHIIGYTREEFLGMNYYRDLCVNADDVMKFRKTFTEEGQVNDYELQIARKDGTIRDVSMSGYATKTERGEVLRYQGLIRDVTEAKRLRRQLLQSERLSAMGKMASHLAHELNNPIYGIMNCLEIIRESLPETNEKRKYLDLAFNECKRTSGLLIKMLKFFKPDDEKKSSTDVNKLIDETLLFYERQFKNLNIRVVTDLGPDLPPLMAVGSHLKQVFINMVINANTAMPSGGELRVGSRFNPEEDNIVVTIQDTGVGIPPRNVERIFDAFFTTKKEVKGVGLGLSICYGFIREHHGRIDVASEVGKGTIFTLYLPLNPPEE